MTVYWDGSAHSIAAGNLLYSQILLESTCDSDAVGPHLSDPRLSGYSDYPAYPLHWYSTTQNSIVVYSL